MPEYVAKSLIRIGGVAAFSEGAPVPEGHVEKYGLHDQVLERDEDGDLHPVIPDGMYDPGEHTVDEVNDYLGTADEAETQRVLQAELDGEKRVGIVGHPYDEPTADGFEQPAEEAGQASAVGTED